MRFLTRNIGWKLLSLAIAVGIWLNKATDPELATILSAPVEFKNYPRDLEISSPIVESINVEARGPSRLLRDLSASHLSAIVDLADVKTPGERTFTLTSNEVRLPSGVRLIRIIPAQLRFRFEKRATRKIRIDVPLSGALPPGLALSRVEVDPPELEVAGPESRVAIAKRAVTDPVELSQLKGDSRQDLSVYIPEPELRFTGSPRVTVKIHISGNR